MLSSQLGIKLGTYNDDDKRKKKLKRALVTFSCKANNFKYNYNT